MKRMPGICASPDRSQGGQGSLSKKCLRPKPFTGELGDTQRASLESKHLEAKLLRTQPWTTPGQAFRRPACQHGSPKAPCRTLIAVKWDLRPRPKPAAHIKAGYGRASEVSVHTAIGVLHVACKELPTLT